VHADFYDLYYMAGGGAYLGTDQKPHATFIKIRNRRVIFKLFPAEEGRGWHRANTKDSPSPGVV